MKKTITATVSSVAAFLAVNGIADASPAKPVKAQTTINNLDTSHTEAVTANNYSENDIVVVKSGDSLNSIASAHHITVTDIYNFNPGVTELIHPGDLIAVSSKGAALLGTNINGATYTEVSSSNQPQDIAHLVTSTTSYDKQHDLTFDELTHANATTSSQSHVTSGTAGSQSYHNNTQASSYNGQQTSAPAHYNAVTHHRYHYGSTPAPNKYKSVANQGNLYAYGNCTYYVFNRRSELGRSIGSTWGNANNWAYSAKRAGFTVNNTPAVGAIFQTGARYYGHVGVVERVNSNGSIYVSEMNYNGHFNNVTHRSIYNVSSYKYIH